MLKTHHGTLFLSFAGRKTMFRLWSLYWLEKSVDTVYKSMLRELTLFWRENVIAVVILLRVLAVAGTSYQILEV